MTRPTLDEIIRVTLASRLKAGEGPPFTEEDVRSIAAKSQKRAIRAIWKRSLVYYIEMEIEAFEKRANHTEKQSGGNQSG